jgi:hypothetical protein
MSEKAVLDKLSSLNVSFKQAMGNVVYNAHNL